MAFDAVLGDFPDDLRADFEAAFNREGVESISDLAFLLGSEGDAEAVSETLFPGMAVDCVHLLEAWRRSQLFGKSKIDLKTAFWIRDNPAALERHLPPNAPISGKVFEKTFLHRFLEKWL